MPTAFRGGGVLWHPAPPAWFVAPQPPVALHAEIRADPSSLAAPGQVVRLLARVSRSGFAHLLVRNPDGSVHFVAANRRVASGGWRRIGPPRGLALVARPPAGRSHVTLVVTAAPLDFGGGPMSAMGLQSALASAPPSSWTLARTHVDVLG